MIKPILHQLLTVDEFYTLSKEIIRAIEASTLDEASKTQMLNRLTRNFDLLESAINRETKNPLTQVLEMDDEQRDRVFLGLRSFIEAHTYHWDTAVSESANALASIIRRHGWSLHNEGFTTQTAALNSLCAELEQEPASNHIIQTEATQWLSKLTEMQAHYEATKQKREELDTYDKPIVTETRKAVYEDLTAVIKYIEGNMLLSASPEMETLTVTLNQIIGQITTSAKARYTRRHNEVEQN